MFGGDGNDVLLSGSGDDSLAGGAGDDILYFGSDYQHWQDMFDGGAGTDQLVLQGYYHAWTNVPGQFAAVERLVFLTKSDTRFGPATEYSDYNLHFFGNQVLPAGATLTVDGSNLVLGDRMIFDGSGETDARFVLIGGGGRDELTGGAGADVIDGGALGDRLAGGTRRRRLSRRHPQRRDHEAADAGFDNRDQLGRRFRARCHVEKLGLTGSVSKARAWRRQRPHRQCRATIS